MSKRSLLARICSFTCNRESEERLPTEKRNLNISGVTSARNASMTKIISIIICMRSTKSAMSVKSKALRTNTSPTTRI